MSLLGRTETEQTAWRSGRSAKDDSEEPFWRASWKFALVKKARKLILSSIFFNFKLIFLYLFL